MKIISHNSYTRKYSILRKIELMIILLIFLSSSFLILNSNNITEIDRDFDNFSQTPLLADDSPVLFEGNENSLNITDYGNLYKYDQQVSLTNKEEVNLTYFLDDVHDWKSSEINFTIQDIHDTREWVSDADYFDIGAPYRIDLSPVVSNIDPPPPPTHNYSADLSRTTIHSTISESGAKAMRLHFSRIEIETDWDYLFIHDDTNTLKYIFTGVETDFYTPWINADTLKLSIDSDGTIQYYGYDIDYYEFYNSSSTSYSLFESSWGYNNNGLFNNYFPGNISDNNAIQLSLLANISRDPDYFDSMRFAAYYGNDYVESYQNITIPRGEVIDGYISFDYYAESAIASNEFYIYCAIDNQIVYNKGLRDITDGGRGIWHNTGKIYMALWSNTSSIFQNIQMNQKFNISIGIMSGASITYSGFEDLFQQRFWFDNVSLVLTTLANSNQDGINLTIDGNYPIDDSSWGRSSLSLNNLWVLNPISIEFTTTSPSLSFNLNTSIFGYRETTSKIDQLNNEGLNYYILENGTIYWEFYHNFYMPSQYSDFEFLINKPLNWEFIYALDPTLLSRPFENGSVGDSFLKINKTNALFPGWWSFKATSPNYLNQSNTKLLKQGEWTHTSFTTGESTIIKTQVNHSNEVPFNLGSTEVNLTIYDPEGVMWFTETQTPLSNGSVFFSELYFDALNTTGGQYDYTLFWSNGTALGGLNSSFLVIHESSFSLIKPNDAISDSITDAFIGDVIPVQVNLTDSENNNPILNAIISYNWTSGTVYFEEASLGIYETILDTSDLGSNGFYEILIESSKVGFLDYNLTLKINLGEETSVQRLQSDYNIELHANSTIKFKYYSLLDDEGIDGATVNISISNPSYYLIENLGNGIYDIEFSTLFTDNIGIFQLNFSFSATGYEPQYYGYQFQIIEQSVDLSVFINSVNIQENTLHEVTFFDIINVSAKAMSIIDKNYISGGNFTWISESYEMDLTEYINNWYNSSIEGLPEYFSSGINFIYLKFEHPNYRTQTFGFEILIERIEFDVDIVGHEDSNPTIKAEIGGSLVLQIELLDLKTNQPIENATVLYEWRYGVGELEEIIPGTYQLTVELPENLQGNFIFNLVISKEGTVYKTTQSSFLLVIGEPQFPIFLIWIIIIISALIISALGVLSLRSYVILPRRRKREAELLTRTQRFKDLQNIQAIVAIHRYSGIPLYSKSYSILEKHKKELFSGFIQAIITVGEEMAGKRGKDGDLVESDEEDGSRTILELDFKYFYCLICDRQDLRIIFILTERASDRLKKVISDLSLGAMLELSEQIENWDGAIHEFEVMFPPIINKYVELCFKETFTINNAKFIAKLRKEDELNSMETRILNVLYSIAKSKREFFLENIFQIIHEKNRDIVIDGIEGLIKKQVIIPTVNTIN